MAKSAARHAPHVTIRSGVIWDAMDDDGLFSSYNPPLKPFQLLLILIDRFKRHFGVISVSRRLFTPFTQYMHAVL